jgi:hypothetical protein
MWLSVAVEGREMPRKFQFRYCPQVAYWPISPSESKNPKLDVPAEASPRD